MIEAAMVFGASARQQIMIVMAAWKMTIVLVGVQPATLLLVVLGARDAGAAQTASVVTGVLVMVVWNATIWTGGGILRRERAEGTLGAALTGVRDPRIVLVGKATGASAFIVVATSVVMSVFLTVMHQPVAIRQPMWFAIGMLALMLTGTVLGSLLSCLFLLTRYGPQLSGILLYPVYLISGLLIPVSDLPSWLARLGDVISLRPAKLFLNHAAAGSVDWWSLVQIIGLTAIYAVLAATAFSHVSRLARARGTLELV